MYLKINIAKETELTELTVTWPANHITGKVYLAKFRISIRT